MTMLAALTILPAVLSRFGDRIARPSRRARASGESSAARDARGLWARWALLIQRHPWPGALAGVAITVTLAAPAPALRPANSDAGNNPSRSTTRHAHDPLAAGCGAGVHAPP